MEEMNEEFEELKELLEQRNLTALRTELQDMNEVDAATFIEELSPEQATLVFRLLPKEAAAEVFSNLEADTQQVIITAITDKELNAIIEDLSVDDAVDMVEELPAGVVKRVLKSAAPETRVLINQFLKYPENSAGSIMTAEYTDLRKTMTVREAIKHIRSVGDDSEQIYTCYVTDATRHLEGVITLKELLFAADDGTIGELMNEDVITAITTDDREAVSRVMMKYDLLTLPVVDMEHRLVGLVTVDDVMDVMEEEATEDFQKMAAMAPSEKPYLKTSVFTLARNRIVWLLVLMVSAMITGAILGKFEAAFAAMPLLVTFIPMLTDTGGNSGSQSSTMIIRGMAVGEIGMHDFFRVFWKELRVALICGGALSLVNFARLMLQYPGQTAVAITVSLAMYATVIMAKTIGGMLPMVANKLKVDPAIMAAPLITTIVDALSLVIYFSIASALLGL